MRWSPALVRIAGGRLRIGASGGAAGEDPAGSGIGCKELAQRYGLVRVRARIPVGTGLVGRIALWPSTISRGSDWSGLTVPSTEIGPAYATNGCGDEAYGAAVRGRLAGVFRDYVIAWSPQSFTVAVDGRTLYRDDKSFDRPRWLGISLSATGPSATTAQLMVEKVAAYSWSGPVRATAGSTGSSTADSTSGSTSGSTGGSTHTSSAGTAPPASSGAQSSPARANAIQDGTAPGPATAGRAAAGAAIPGAAANGDGTLAAALDPGSPGRAWLIAGGLAALGVLAGIVRAARAARRRPVVPR
jgi:hypothetical protein